MEELTITGITAGTTELTQMAHAVQMLKGIPDASPLTVYVKATVQAGLRWSAIQYQFIAQQFKEKAVATQQLIARARCRHTTEVPPEQMQDLPKAVMLQTTEPLIGEAAPQKVFVITAAEACTAKEATEILGEKQFGQIAKE